MLRKTMKTLNLLIQSWYLKHLSYQIGNVASIGIELFRIKVIHFIVVAQSIVKKSDWELSLKPNLTKMSEKSPLNRTLISLMIFYIFGALFAILASGSILMHVNPYSKCLLYSSHIGGGKLSYGNYASKYYLKISCARVILNDQNCIR